MAPGQDPIQGAVGAVAIHQVYLGPPPLRPTVQENQWQRPPQLPKPVLRGDAERHRLAWESKL